MSRLTIFVFVTLLTACGIDTANEDGMNKEPDVNYIKNMRKEPALEWLASNKNKYPFASNRFKAANEAKIFIENLITIGAEAVFVANPMDEPSRIAREGGPYSDTLIVKLPQNKEARKQLFSVFESEAKREGFDQETDAGQNEVLLWWD